MDKMQSGDPMTEKLTKESIGLPVVREGSPFREYRLLGVSDSHVFLRTDIGSEILLRNDGGWVPQYRCREQEKPSERIGEIFQKMRQDRDVEGCSYPMEIRDIGLAFEAIRDYLDEQFEKGRRK